MRSNWTIIEQVKDRQKTVFRNACDLNRYGKTRKALSMDSGIGYDSLCDYANGDTEMPLSAFILLIGVLPTELLSLLLPDGHSIVRIPENIDHDAIAEWAEAYNARKLAAHRKDSECGPEIGPNEKNELDGIVVQFPGSAAA